MDKFLPHETRILKSRVPKKKTNEDDDEDEEPEMGRRSRSTRFENLSRERRFDEEESRVEGKKNKGRRSSIGVGKVNGGTRVLKTQVPRGFFPHRLPPLATQVLKT